ncbi:MAG: CidA/LrgA family protein [Desulfovibrionaceae bacterium]
MRTILYPVLRALRRVLRRRPALQLVLLAGLWLAGEGLSRGLALPVPGSILGIGLALVLLAAGWLTPRSLRLGADWLLTELLLFFVPAVMALLRYPELWGITGLKLLGIILAGTAAVMAVTALTVGGMQRLLGARS